MRVLIRLVLLAWCSTTPSWAMSERRNDSGCMKSGCGGQLCVRQGEAVLSTCRWREEFACYRDAVCERQSDGECGWRSTPSLTQCLLGKRGRVLDDRTEGTH